jgi:hypothetical protein
MTERFKKLLENAKRFVMSPEEKEQQRRSFAYGNTHFENDRITREIVEKAAEDLKKGNDQKN